MAHVTMTTMKLLAMILLMIFLRMIITLCMVWRERMRTPGDAGDDDFLEQCAFEETVNRFRSILDPTVIMVDRQDLASDSELDEAGGMIADVSSQ